MGVDQDRVSHSLRWKKSFRVSRICSLLRTACILSLLGALGQPADALTVPGVGFSLDPDHGTAAVFFANGSSAAVARIEGSPGYKDFMRSEPSRHHPHRMAFCRTLPTNARRLLPLCALSPHAESVEALLLALKDAVSSRLDTSFCYADVALSLPYEHNTYQRIVIADSLQDIGLRQARGSGTFGVLTASSAAIDANRVSSLPPDEENTQILLVIGHSKSIVDVALVCEEFGVIERVRHDYAIHNVDTDRVDRLDKVANLVRSVSEAPGGLCGVTNASGEVHALVLHGDSVGDSGFLQVLTEIFGADKVENAYAVEPVHSAAIGVAMSSFEHMNDVVGFREPAALGCRWRSKLYWEAHGEL